MIKDNLTRYRTLKNISQRELGRRIGMSGQYIAQLERGERTNPTKETLNKLATALDITVGQLFHSERHDIMKINEKELNAVVLFEAKEILHCIASVMCADLANEDKALMIENMLERVNIIMK